MTPPSDHPEYSTSKLITEHFNHQQTLFDKPPFRFHNSSFAFPLPSNWHWNGFTNIFTPSFVHPSKLSRKLNILFYVSHHAYQWLVSNLYFWKHFSLQMIHLYPFTMYSKFQRHCYVLVYRGCTIFQGFSTTQMTTISLMSTVLRRLVHCGWLVASHRPVPRTILESSICKRLSLPLIPSLLMVLTYFAPFVSVPSRYPSPFQTVLFLFASSASFFRWIL